jgi:PTH2 family peptidyl-tRNA hydrolase
MEYKLVIAVREDLGLSSGKMAVQVAHAAVKCAFESRKGNKKWFSRWMKEGQKKVVVKANDLAELRDLERKAARLKMTVALIEDAGLTEVPPGTPTCLGIGPAPNSRIDAVTGRHELW